MIEKYTKLPVTIEAIQFTPNNYKECEAFIGKENYDNTLNYPNIKTLEGIMRVDEYDWIIKGVAGEFYAVKPEIFKRTYVRATEGEKVLMSVMRFYPC